jgi:ubiquinone/menaquinone biosynthesis C-methylase UbiE
MTLEFTGERFLTECHAEMVYEHWHRYLLARDYAAGKRVLDVASGEGYGSHLLAGIAESVVGVDLSAEAVAHATQKYAKENLQYIAASCTQIPLPDASFDFIVSFETIEHIDEAAQHAFLREVNRLLKPDGVFLISSPNRPEYSERNGYKNEYHVKELDQDELRQQLQVYWPNMYWAAQRLGFYSISWSMYSEAQEARAYAFEDRSAYPEPMYFLVFCAKSEFALAEIRPSLSIVSDSSNAVYDAWSNTYRQNVQLHERNQRLERELAELTRVPVEASPIPALREPWLVRFARKLSG